MQAGQLFFTNSKVVGSSDDARTLCKKVEETEPTNEIKEEPEPQADVKVDEVKEEEPEKKREEKDQRPGKRKEEKEQSSIILDFYTKVEKTEPRNEIKEEPEMKVDEVEEEEPEKKREEKDQKPCERKGEKEQSSIILDSYMKEEKDQRKGEEKQSNIILDSYIKEEKDQRPCKRKGEKEQSSLFLDSYSKSAIYSLVAAIITWICELIRQLVKC